MAVLSPVAKQQFFTDAGTVAAGYKLYTYAANTTTPQATYSNAAGTSANANPIVLDAQGRATIFMDPALTYDYVLKTASDVTVWTQEDVTAGPANSANIVFTQSGTGAVARTVQDKAREIVSVKDFDASGDGATDDLSAIQSAIDYIAALGQGEVHFSPASYAISGAIALKSGVKLVGNGATLVKTSTGGATYALSAAGATSGSATALTANAAVRATQVSVASSSGFAAGDYALIRSTAYVDAVNSNGRYQELVKIASVASGTLTLTNPLLAAYATADSSEVIKVSPVKDASMRGFRVEVPRNAHPTFNGGHVFADLAANVTIEGNQFFYPDTAPAFRCQRSAHLLFIGNHVVGGQNAVAGGSYGIGVLVDESSHHVGVSNNSFAGINQNAIQNRASHITFTGNLIDGAADSGVNTHASTSSHVVIAGNVITSANLGIAVAFSGGTGADSDIAVEGNSIFGCNGSGISVTGDASTANDPSRILVANNIVRACGMNIASQACIFVSTTGSVMVSGNVVDAGNFGGAQTPSAAVKLSAATNCQVSNNFVTGTTAGYGVQLFNCTDVDVLHNHFTNISSHNVITSGSTRCRVIGNKADDTTVSLDSATEQFGNSWKGYPQAGAASVALSAASFASASVTFPIAFPSAPAVTASVPDTGFPLMAEVGNITATGCTVYLRDATATSRTTTQNVQWIAVPK